MSIIAVDLHNAPLSIPASDWLSVVAPERRQEVLDNYAKIMGPEGKGPWGKYRERYKEKRKAWRKANRDQYRIAQARCSLRHYHKNKEKILSARKEKRLIDLEKARRYDREYGHTRRSNDPDFKLRGVLRVRIREAILRNGVSRASARTMELIGCSIQHVRAHLEKQFKPGMSWENHGEWHIDHKVACSRFDLTDELQQRACFHWSNLQPLWAAENLQKRNR